MMATSPLADILDQLPEDFALIACDGEKRPIDPFNGQLLSGWQLSGGEDREELQASPYLQAVGVLAGEPSGGLLVVDFDGPEGEESFLRLTGHRSIDLPPTIACSSGKPHRYKLFLVVEDQELWPLIAGFGSGTKLYPDLEMLWNGRQGVIAGRHPETEGYFFLEGSGPNEISKPAFAPEWLIESLIIAPSSESHSLPPSADIATLRQLVSFLKPEEYGDYNKWRNLGMALKLADPSEDCKQLFDEFSQKADKYDAQFLEKQWKAYATAEEFKRKFPNCRPITIASFVKEAMENGCPPLTFSAVSEQEGSIDIEELYREQEFEKVLKDTRECPSIVNLLDFLQYQKEIIIRWNELKRCIVVTDEKGEHVIEPKLANVLLAKRWRINAGKQNATDVVITLALENPYNPVADYFNGLRDRDDLPLVSDEQLADCFGFDYADSLSINLMRIHLRACASRGLFPGGKLDSLLIIKGQQGTGKSTILKTLSPDPSWYDETTRLSFDSRDALSSLNSAFVYEFSEIEKILLTADVAQFKSWITRENDKYVEKYETVSKEHERRCCLFGTTNQEDFLMDPTGARRFFICETVRQTNYKLLAQLRDALWRQSLIEYENGSPFFLSNDDELFFESQKKAMEATISHPWEAALTSHLDGKKDGDFVSSRALLNDVIGKEIARCTKGDYMTLSNIMRKIGWIKKRKRQAGFSNPVDGYIFTPLLLSANKVKAAKSTQIDDEDLDSIF